MIRSSLPKIRDSPNAILITYPNRSGPLRFFKGRGSDVISLLHAQAIHLIFQLYNF